MKLKPILKYQLFDYRKTLLMMYLCVYVFVIIIEISNSQVNALTLRGKVIHNGIGGAELASLITLFVIALNSFKPYFKLFSSNGISRKTLFCSVSIGLGIAAAFMAFIDTLNAFLFSRVMGYHSMFQMIYYDSIDGKLAPNTFSMFAQQFLWQIFSYFCIAMIGFLITSLFYRMSKGFRIAFFIGMPALLGNFLPLLDQVFWDGQLSHAFQNFANFALGFSNGYNSYIAMASMFILTAITGVLAWLLVRRANVKV